MSGEQANLRYNDSIRHEGGPPHPNYRLVFEDHFDGNILNEDEWSFRLGERLGGVNLRENVSVADSRLRVKFDRQHINGEMRFTGGGIVSKRLFGYGYYEAKGKLWGGGGGLHSSFWSMGLNDGDGLQAPDNTIIEIDGYEVDSGRPSSIGLNVHYYVGTHRTVGGVTGAKEYEPVDTSLEDFVFGYEWLPNRINWYLNGRLIRSLDNPLFYGPQNVWLTALGCEAFDREIDIGRLPGESSWDYFRYYRIDLLGVNMAVNPGFEYNCRKSFDLAFVRPMGTPVGWLKEGSTPRAAFVHITEEAYSGECVLRHDDAEPYQVTTKLHIPFLPNEAFLLTAMVRNPMGGSHQMRASGFGGEERVLDIPKTDAAKWMLITIDNIRVQNGQCTVAFRSDCEGNRPLEVDDVSFVQTTGRQPHVSLDPYPEERAREPLVLNEILVDDELPGSGYREFGSWESSGLPGYVQRSRYAEPASGNYAVWAPAIRKPGSYKVSFYNVCYSNRADRAKAELYHRGGVEERIFSQQGTSGWIEFGTFWLEPGDYVKLSSVPDSSGGCLAADTVKFEPESTESLRRLVDRSCLFMPKQNRALIYGRFERMDKTNPTVFPLVKDGVLTVPLKPAAVYFGAGTFNNSSGSGGIDIFYSDYMIRVQAGSNVMNVRNRDVTMPIDAFERDGSVYVPFAELTRAFGKCSFVASTGLGIACDGEIGIDETDEESVQLLSKLLKQHQ